ncbi:transketolase [Liquorilactobacillus mali]|uniref:transketolase n=1 Tax=Liquorilactobacillus mali TaxID=1618 RepID=UPI0026558000|nr:transketolase [Liquorilactobacillus mali]MDN7144697.1 transketolase [Liquorilactobacillus mali]
MFDEQDKLCVNAIRMLSIDTIEKANSGHPGLPMGAAPMAYVLWSRHLKIYPKKSKWFDRDRFVLSAGHGSAMLYSLLHLAGYQVSLNDLKQFRQEDSLTPGHPEFGKTDGVEATTGPLGQGLGMAVGMAMAEKHLAAIYNKPDKEIVDHYTYSLVGDGDLMEGISHEAASLAGHLKLGKLIVLYDSNDISLDGPTKMSFDDNAKKRFEGYGWEYIRVEDGNNLKEIDSALKMAKKDIQRPTIIEVKTVIGYGSPDQGTNKVHGAPLGKENVAITRKSYDWNYQPFEIPDEVYERFHKLINETGKKSYENWEERLKDYEDKYPSLAYQFKDGLTNKVDFNWIKEVADYHEGSSAEASRITGHKVISAISKFNPTFWGGSADLFSSNKTNAADTKAFEPSNPKERNIWFGVREFGQAAAINGIALHGGTRTYGSTFFVFSDYLRGALRLSALQHLPVTYVFTHDSIAVGEDGPTHEPIEQLMSLRAMPNVNVIRPADANEVIAAWRIALNADRIPTVLVLTRQGLPVLPKTDKLADEGVKHGAYVLLPAQKDVPDGILIATGSEVSLAQEAQKQLLSDGIDVSVVSMPSFELFEAQRSEYKEKILPNSVSNRMSIEMGATLGWERYVGRDGVAIGIDKFGASGNGPLITKHYGFNVENIVTQYKKAFIK